MALRQALAVVLGAGMAVPPATLAAPGTGLLKGTVVTTAGLPVAGADVELLSLDDGTSTRLRTSSGGAFEADLAPGSYKVELQKGYVVVRGPEMVALAAGATAPADLVVAAAAQATPEGTQPAATTAGNAGRTGNIIALTVFGGALAGVVVYAATRGHEEDRLPPTTSGSR